MDFALYQLWSKIVPVPLQNTLSHEQQSKMCRPDVGFIVIPPLIDLCHVGYSFSMKKYKELDLLRCTHVLCYFRLCFPNKITREISPIEKQSISTKHFPSCLRGSSRKINDLSQST